LKDLFANISFKIYGLEIIGIYFALATLSEEDPSGPNVIVRNISLT